MLTSQHPAALPTEAGAVLSTPWMSILGENDESSRMGAVIQAQCIFHVHRGSIVAYAQGTFFRKRTVACYMQHIHTFPKN